MHRPGTGSGGCTNPTRNEGSAFYNIDNRVPQVCAGNEWIALGAAGSKWTQVESFSKNGCAIKGDGTLWCWGNQYLGDGVAYTEPSHIVQVGTNATGTIFSDWLSVSSQYNAVCGLRENGTAWCFGRQTDGALGNNVDSSAYIYQPVQVGTSGTGTLWNDWIQVSAGCGVRSDGSAWCWGNNANGEVGDNSDTDRLVPTRVGTAGTGTLWSDWVEVIKYSDHACGLRQDDTLWCWGRESNGQLGNGLSGGSKWFPQQVGTVGTGTLWSDWESIADNTFYQNTCATRQDGTAWCWGQGDEGELGDGTNTVTQTTPVQVGTVGSSTIFTDWNKISHTCGLRDNGTVWCWGKQFYSAIGADEFTSQLQLDKTVPEQVLPGNEWVDISVDVFDSLCAINQKGAIYCIGENNDGETGNGAGYDGYQEGEPSKVVGDYKWLKISSGGSDGYADNVSCGIRTDGIAMCWGGNRYYSSLPYGRFGAGSYDDPYASSVPIEVSGGFTWTDIEAARHDVCALRDNGSVYCWGQAISNVPTALPGGFTFSEISGGGTVFCGIRDTDQQLMCWNNPGDTPVLRGGGHQFTSISSGYGSYSGDHGCGIRTDGAALCWGYSTDPVLVGGGHSWKQLSVGLANVCGVRTDDVGMCWGENWVGEFGNGTTTSSATPVLINGGYSWEWIEVSEFYSVCGKRTDGVNMCWGENYYGEFGNGTINVNSLVPVLGASDIVFNNLSMGDGHQCGVANNGDGYCWGENNVGQLGNGRIMFQTGAKPIGCNNPPDTAGSIFYNSSSKALQFCDGGSWVSLGKTPNPCTGTDSAPAIGETCTDGTIYAGISPDGDLPMYTTPADAGTMPWNNGNVSGWVDTTMDNCTPPSPGNVSSCVTGEENTALLVAEDSDSITGGTQSHLAAAYCDTLSAHGHSDWYLPSMNELNVLYINKNVGDLNGTFDETGSFPDGRYWTSSERTNNDAVAQYFDSGSQISPNSKHYTYSVRCVRR